MDSQSVYCQHSQLELAPSPAMISYGLLNLIRQRWVPTYTWTLVRGAILLVGACQSRLCSLEVRRPPTGACHCSGPSQ
eukprot:6491943-Amphidinium_carterae.3